MALHDSTHTATSTVVGPKDGHVLWTRDLGGNITPGPVVGSDGTIYSASSTGVLFALNPATGSVRWRFNGGGAFAGGDDLSTSPTITSSGALLWPGPSDTLFELSATGAKLWSHTFSSEVLSPVINGSRAYIATAGGTVWAVDLGGSLPQLRWSLHVGHVSFGSPVVGPDGNVVTTADNKVVAIADRGATGVIRWQHTLDAQVEVSASVGPLGSVYVESDRATVYAFGSDGHAEWHKKIGQESYSSSSVTASGLLYFGDNGGVLHIVRASSGEPVAADHGLGGLWAAQAIDANGDVYFGTQGKQIDGYGPDGHRLFAITASGRIDSYPALTGNGVLVIGDEKGTLYGIGDAGASH
jgi:outer membrane protein assembly factor BamB